jgi:hypothetical protein
MILVIKATIASPTKPQAIDVRRDVASLLVARLIKAIRLALLPPLSKPVVMAIATIPQEERRRKEIKFISINYWAWGIGHWALGMGHGAWGMGHGAWGIGHGALGMGKRRYFTFWLLALHA